MELRTAEQRDVLDILLIYSQAAETLRRRGVDQWQDGYPSVQTLKLDMQKDQCYVAERCGQIAGTLAICLGLEPSYAQIYDGAWKRDGEYLSVHRFAVAPDFRGGQTADFMMQSAVHIARLLNVCSVRSDTQRDNRPMQRVLERCGFELCGTIYLEDASERIAYQYLL